MSYITTHLKRFHDIINLSKIIVELDLEVLEINPTLSVPAADMDIVEVIKNIKLGNTYILNFNTEDKTLFFERFFSEDKVNFISNILFEECLKLSKEFIDGSYDLSNLNSIIEINKQEQKDEILPKLEKLGLFEYPLEQKPMARTTYLTINTNDEDSKTKPTKFFLHPDSNHYTKKPLKIFHQVILTLEAIEVLGLKTF